MPAWVGRLDPSTIKALAVYVHSLGGGEVMADWQGTLGTCQAFEVDQLRV